MASALQKLFKKRLSKQQPQQQERSQSEISPEGSTTAKKRQTISGPANLLTVSSLNSPSYTSIHRTLSSTSSTGISNHGQDSGRNHGHNSSTGDPSKIRSRTNSLSATSLLREGSYDGRSWRTAVVSDSHTGINVDQFGAIIQDDPLTDSMRSPTLAQDSKDEDELECNDVYDALMSKIETTSKLANAKVLLIPCKIALANSNISSSILNNEQYISLHALSPSNLFKDQYESVRLPVSQLDVSEDPWSRIHLTATLEPESHTVQVTLSKTSGTDSLKPKHLRRTLKVMSETTVYRSLIRSTGYNISDSRKERIRLRVLIVGEILVSPTITSKRSSKLAASIVSSAKTLTPKVESKLKDDQESSVTFPTKDIQTVQKPDDSSLVSSDRQFLSDFLFLLDPPKATGPLRGPLNAALETLERSSTEFAMAYIYVPGFDSYNVSRIRGGILARSWKAFEEARIANGDKERGEEGDIDLTTWLGNDGRARLLLLLENVVMGYCHAKVYGSICAIRHDADDTFDSIVATYHDHGVSLTDLGVAKNNNLFRSHALDLAEAILCCLGDADEDMENLIADKDKSKIRQMAAYGKLPTQFDAFENASSASSQRMRCRIRTPLDSLEVMHATLEEINKASIPSSRIQSRNESLPAGRLGADELLPILAFVLIRIAPRKLSSLLYYVRLFGISDVTPAKHNWALTTFEAVVRYLADDPLELSCGRGGTARLQNLGKAVSIRSTRSSMTSASLGQFEGVQTVKWESLESRENEVHDRARRASLPSSHLMKMDLPRTKGSNLSQGSFAELNLASSSKRDGTLSPTNSLLSHEGVIDVEEDGDTTIQTFKKPGKPASALSDRFDSHNNQKRPSISIWQAENRDALSDTMKSYSTDGAPTHKRAASVSGDLLIRPQIVVRASNKSRDSQNVILNRPLSPQDGSNSSRATSPEFGTRMNLSNSQSSNRRRSIDSWASLNNFFYGDPSRSDMSRQPSTSGGNIEEEMEGTTGASSSSHGRSELLRPSLYKSTTAQSTSWLPTWANDWSNLSRRPSQTSTNECGTEKNDTSAEGRNRFTRPLSITSEDAERSNLSVSPRILSRSISNHSGSAIGFPSLDSMPSLEPHETSLLSTENDDAASVSSPRDRSSILSSPSSILSGSVGLGSGQTYDQSTVKGLRGSWYMNDSNVSSLGKSQSFSIIDQTSPTPQKGGKRSKTRSRLLSSSEPSDPLPPRLTTTEAAETLPSLFASKASIAPKTGSIEEIRYDQRPKPSSTVSADILSTSSTRPAKLIARSKSSDHHQDFRPFRNINQRSSIIDRNSQNLSTSGQHNESGLSINSISSHTSPPFQFIRLHIPSPVDERADPMATPSSTAFP